MKLSIPRARPKPSALSRVAAWGAAALVAALYVGCAAEEPKPAAPEPEPTCIDKWGASPAWSSSDTAGLPAPGCEERASGLFACNKRGKVYDCFDCDGVKTTYDPNDSGAGSLKALGVDDAELAALEKNYTEGCVKHVDWDAFATDAITDHLLCKEAMAGLKVCRNIDGNVQWWFMSGAAYRRTQTQASLGNSKGTTHTLRFPAAGVDVLDVASYEFLGCSAVTATKNPGWDLWIEGDADRSLVVDLTEPQQAAQAPSAADLARLNEAFTTCEASYGGWE